MSIEQSKRVGPTASDQNKLAKPGRRREERQGNRQRRVVIGRRCDRTTVLRAACLVWSIGRMTRRHLSRMRCRHDSRSRSRYAVLHRTKIRRHRQLLKQQAQQRDERNPAMVAVTKQHVMGNAQGFPG